MYGYRQNTTIMTNKKITLVDITSLTHNMVEYIRTFGKLTGMNPRMKGGRYQRAMKHPKAQRAKR